MAQFLHTKNIGMILAIKKTMPAYVGTHIASAVDWHSSCNPKTLAPYLHGGLKKPNMPVVSYHSIYNHKHLSSYLHLQRFPKLPRLEKIFLPQKLKAAKCLNLLTSRVSGDYQNANS